jgi:hypothetical protein
MDAVASKLGINVTPTAKGEMPSIYEFVKYLTTQGLVPEGVNVLDYLLNTYKEAKDEEDKRRAEQFGPGGGGGGFDVGPGPGGGYRVIRPGDFGDFGGFGPTGPTYSVEVEEVPEGSAAGGIIGLAQGGRLGQGIASLPMQYAAAGKLLRGPGDGMSDDIHANISGRQEARLADGEFVIPADVVSHLGNGSTDAGARQLYAMMNRIREARTGRTRQAPEVNPRSSMPA